MTEHEKHPDIVEQAIISRLRGLKQMPVDTQSLDAALERQIPRPRQFWQRMWRPVTAVAASIIVVIAVGLALSAGSSEAHASPAELAQFHRDIVAGKVAVMRADDMKAANQAITALAGNTIQLPEVPGAHQMACCMRDVKDKKMACVLFENHGTPVTLSVAKASDFQGPKSGYHTESISGVQMVMMERDGKWVCMMSEMSMDELKALAEKVRF